MLYDKILLFFLFHHVYIRISLYMISFKYDFCICMDLFKTPHCLKKNYYSNYFNCSMQSSICVIS